MTTLLANIRTLINVRASNELLRGAALADLPCLHNAFLIVEDGVIADYGAMSSLKHATSQFSYHYDLTGQLVLPSWCDSHTHLVFAGSREEEFIDKIKGLSYAEIAEKGGGILNSARKLNETSEVELFNQSFKRLQEISRLGTGAVEIKTGYGLTVEGELKMLRVIQELKKKSHVQIKSTFLGAHAIPLDYKENRQGYIDLIIQEMLPQIAHEKLADYIDVFCEDGFFTPQETEMICKAGMQYALKPRIHANQLKTSGGVQTGVKLGAISVDHLEHMDEAAINSLAKSSTIGTLLPGAAFFLKLPYQPARALIRNNCAIALASDYNPGSCPSGNMNLIVALACIQLRMLPEEAINAATINGAFALELEQQVGSISKGKRANLIVTKPVPSYNYLPYSFGSNLIDKVMLDGNWMNE